MTVLAPRSVVELGRGRETDTFAVTYIGNATTLVEVGGLRLLTDPNFLHQGDHAALGGGLRTKRLLEPACTVEEVLPVDVVLLSHHHDDHFDDIAAEGLPKDTPIVTTEHAARKLRRQGFTDTHPLRTWEAVDITAGPVRIRASAMPARHAPGLIAKVLPPVMGTVLDVAVGDRRLRAYVTGDTLLHEAMEDVPRRFPGIDLVLIHLGGARIAGIQVSMDGEQGAAAIELLDPDRALPVHFEDYSVMRSPLSEFTDAVAARGLRTEVCYLDRGGRLELELPERPG
ncbi:MAG TPA: MBL fold metallo-hydrolase [Aquihabitans sp.]|nr:MBL fold metallo-hydrolase [Aquihabitans sp.]